MRLGRRLGEATGAGMALLEEETASLGVGDEEEEADEAEEEGEHNGQRAPEVGTTGRGMHRGPGQKYRWSSADGA